MEYLTFQASETDAGKRLDAYLAENIADWSRVRLQKIVADGDVAVNETPAKSSYKIRGGDQIEIELPAPVIETFEPEDIPLDIVFEDEHLAVIDKPAGMVVHPGAGVKSGTLANAIAYHFKFRIPDSKFENRVGIVHRLDKLTSGLIVAAKSEDVHEQLSEQFRRREVFKSYVALAHGEIAEKSGQIDQPIAREKHNRTKMAIRAHGRAALSLWQIRKRYERFTSLNVEIKTGRTHQIRVHLAHINH
ncbi:MAG: RluA family pseudouridine synthase, partial [Acidobacteriota bacterium]|nr:RluA family pseudouridine synthase [Acidobacteriota bacterium]